MLTPRYSLAAVAALATVLLIFAGGLFAAALGTHEMSVCATASDEAHTVQVDGVPVATTPAQSNTVCTTTTLTDATVTVTTTAPTTSTTAPTTTNPPPPPPAPGDTFGIAVGYPGSIRDFNGGRYDEYMGWVASLGATVVRTDYGTGSGTTFQSAYTAAVAHGLQVVPIVMIKGTWTTATAQSTAQDLVNRYPNVRKVELGNEPNGGSQYGAAPNINQYVALATTVANTLRAGIPEVKLISAGIADYTITDASHINAPTFMQGEVSSGLAALVDCWGYHPYSDYDWSTQLPNITSIVAPTGKPLCVTETGRDTLNFTEQQQAAAVTSRIGQARASAAISDLYWYSAQDHNTNDGGASRENHFGLFHTDWSPKPGVAAYRAAVAP